MTKNGLHSLALGLLAACSVQARAEQPADPRAADAAKLFASFCVKDMASRDRAVAVFGNGNEIANRLPNDLVTRLQSGQSGGVAWAINGPNQSQLLLGYSASGICEVRIADADEKAVTGAFLEVASSSAAQAGAKLTATPAATRKQGGAKLTYQTYSYPSAGKTAQLAITTSDKRVGAQQHMLTFALVQ